LAASFEAEMDFFVMSTNDRVVTSRTADSTPPSAESTPGAAVPSKHPAPPMLWMLLPVALLLLLAYLSR